jgi:hypothetical protein
VVGVLNARQNLGTRLGELRRADLVGPVEVVEGVQPGDDLVVERRGRGPFLTGSGAAGLIRLGRVVVAHRHVSSRPVAAAGRVSP